MNLISKFYLSNTKLKPKAVYILSSVEEKANKTNEFIFRNKRNNTQFGQAGTEP